MINALKRPRNQPFGISAYFSLATVNSAEQAMFKLTRVVGFVKSL